MVADDGASAALRVHASIRNQGREAQPAPLLRVVLQDRCRRIAMRDLAARVRGHGRRPGSRGGTAARAAAKPAAAPLLEPGRRIEADVALLGPRRQGGGLHGCLPAARRRRDRLRQRGPATLR
ncbi:MAG: hypothetical protein U1F11_05150 [Steroidobacteraceae bacterium]